MSEKKNETLELTQREFLAYQAGVSAGRVQVATAAIDVLVAYSAKVQQWPSGASAGSNTVAAWLNSAAEAAKGKALKKGLRQAAQQVGSMGGVIAKGLDEIAQSLISQVEPNRKQHIELLDQLQKMPLNTTFASRVAELFRGKSG